VSKGTVVKASEVMPFSLPGYEHEHESRMLIDKSNAGSERLLIGHFTLKAGQISGGGTHRAPNDEVYYVISGVANLNMDGVDYDLEKGMVVFIPGGTFHALSNKSETEDFVVLTIFPIQPEPGVNVVYDARLQAWGKTFRTIDE
jgi:quercetin dioxygenase-like cupin family protein